MAVVLCASPAFAQSAQTVQSTQSAQTPPQQTSTETPPLPQNIDKIRNAVNRPPKLVVDDGQLRIYVEVIAKWPRFDEKTKGYDFINGATPGGNPMSHKEFLNMVTPKEMYGSGGIRPTEMLQFALVNWLGQAIIKKGLEEIRKARNEREIAEIRARIDRELAALKGGGGGGF